MKAGVYNVEQFDPDPFLANLNIYGLPWHEKTGAKLAFDDYE